MTDNAVYLTFAPRPTIRPVHPNSTETETTLRPTNPNVTVTETTYGSTDQDCIVITNQDGTRVRKVLGNSNGTDVKFIDGLSRADSSNALDGAVVDVTQSSSRVCLHISRIFSLKGLVDSNFFASECGQHSTPSSEYELVSCENNSSFPQLSNSASATNLVSLNASSNANTTFTGRSPNPRNFQNEAMPNPTQSSLQESKLVNKPSFTKDPMIPVCILDRDPCPTLSKKKTLAVAPILSEKRQDSPQQGCTYNYKCQICGHTFSQKGNLCTHMRIHEDERPFPCQDCGYAARQLVQLKRHAKHHTFRFEFKCRFCSYSSKMKSTTTKHCASIHSDLLKALNLNDND